MPRLVVFNHVSLDGYFVDGHGDMSWAHQQDAEWNAFAEGNARGGGRLVFGRKTYEMMAGFWPTPQALQLMPVVAAQMNQLQKVVFSRTLERAAWNNTTLITSDPAAAVRALKREPGTDMAIMGSGTIVSLLAQEGLIDEFQLVVNPIVLGAGRTLFAGVTDKKKLKHTRTRTFGNGNVLLCYEPLAG